MSQVKRFVFCCWHQRIQHEPICHNPDTESTILLLEMMNIVQCSINILGYHYPALLLASGFSWDQFLAFSAFLLYADLDLSVCVPGSFVFVPLIDLGVFSYFFKLRSWSLSKYRVWTSCQYWSSFTWFFKTWISTFTWRMWKRKYIWRWNHMLVSFD